jgi:hypothetical protein
VIKINAKKMPTTNLGVYRMAFVVWCLSEAI